MLQGIYCPSITVTDENGAIDYELWGRHLDHLADAGVNGVLIFGSIGEFYAFPTEEKIKAIKFAVDRVAGRMKVIAGVSGTIYDDVLRMTKEATAAKADAVMAVSPYYFGPSDGAALRYFSGIAKETDLPIVLYNFPARTGSDLSPELVARIAQEIPSVCGTKDTVDCASHTRKVIQAVRKVRKDFAVLSGFDEYYVTNRLAGGNGVLCGLTNVVPETFVAMHRSFEAGDYTKALECARSISRLMSIYDVCDLFISAVKCGVRAQGLPISTHICEPAVQASSEQQHEVEELLAAESQLIASVHI
jgi:4-hydroxy-tetrahydrodipicolinate synthase